MLDITVREDGSLDVKLNLTIPKNRDNAEMILRASQHALQDRYMEFNIDLETGEVKVPMYKEKEVK